MVNGAERSFHGTGRAGRFPALLTGFGLGAFIDGIVLHQVLQWHHLVVKYKGDDTLAGLEANTFWDGIFHLASWVIVLVGVVWLAARAADLHAMGLPAFIGMLMIGTGVFHVVDQLVFHLALEAHHIRMVENYQVYDWSFFGIGLLLVAAGLAVANLPQRAAPPE